MMLDKKKEGLLVHLIRDLESFEHEFKEDISRGFNIFAAAGLVRQEIRHSAILAYLMNPIESHGLGDSLARKIISYATQKSDHSVTPNALKVALADFDDLIVTTEAGYNKKRIDILAHSPRNEIVIVIENKVDSSEGDNQLKTYSEKINQDTYFKNYKKLFVYLTLDGNAPSEEEEWIGIGYKKILDILNDILLKSDIHINDDKKIFINHYIDLVRKHIMEEINPALLEACRDIYRKHKFAIDLIKGNLPTPVSDVQELFEKEKDHEIRKFLSNPRTFSFLPKTLLQDIPETDGTDWHGQKRPLLIWFMFRADKVGIIIEVGPMANSDGRNRLVQELERSLGTKSRRSGTYSRVYSSYVKFELDELDEWDEQRNVELKNIMDKLYAKLASEKLIDKIQLAVKEARLTAKL
jgi:PD-(D/E)XK nuclease superfamily